MNSSEKGFRISPPWGKSLQGYEDLTRLLSLVYQPSVLFIQPAGQLLFANSAFLEWTGWDLGDILSHKWIWLLNETTIPKGDGEEGFLTHIRCKHRDPHLARVRLTDVDHDGKRYTIAFFSPESSPRAERERKFEDRLLDVMEKISSISLETSLQHSLKYICAMVSRLLEVEACALYQVSPLSPQMVKICDSGVQEIFPPVMTLADLVRLTGIQIWTPGRRALTLVHRYGQEQGLTFVASASLGNAGGAIGLLVLGGRGEVREERVLSTLRMLRRQIGAFLENHLKVEVIQERLLAIQQEFDVLEAAINGVEEGIFILKPDLRIDKINQSAEWLFGYAQYEIIGVPVDNVLIGSDRLRPALEAALEGIPIHTIGDLSLHRRNGVSFPAVVQVVRVPAEGKVNALVVLVTDISEGEAIRIRTQQLEQRALLGEVTSVFAHEVRNPINNLYTGLQVLSATLPPEDATQEHLARLQQDCVRLNNLMESVLNFSRNTQYKFEPVDLKDFLQRILDRWRPRFGKVNVEAQLFVQEGTPKAFADPRSLEQVFTNLVSNAVDAMSKKGGHLTIQVSPKVGPTGRNEVVVAVLDDGPGIPDEIRDRIFEPFVTTKSSGTGLGLAITKRIVTAHHGSIKVNSFPGGTVFEVTLQAYSGEST
jgi:PAS domain S-box-containing protein